MWMTSSIAAPYSRFPYQPIDAKIASMRESFAIPLSEGFIGPWGSQSPLFAPASVTCSFLSNPLWSWLLILALSIISSPSKCSRSRWTVMPSFCSSKFQTKAWKALVWQLFYIGIPSGEAVVLVRVLWYARHLARICDWVRVCLESIAVFRAPYLSCRLEFIQRPYLR